MFFEEEEKKPLNEIKVGENIERFSVEELEARILALETEITRTKAEKHKKSTVMSAAQNFFKK